MIEKKDSNPNPGSDPTNPSAPSAPDDENPWDDDGGGRTLAQEGPSFEMPSNIPSPITVPPPPAPAPVIPSANPVKKRSATMMGFGPPGPALPGQTGPGLPMGGGMGFTPAGGVPVTNPGTNPVAPPPAPAPVAPPAATKPSSPEISPGALGAPRAPPPSGIGAPPPSNKRPPPVPPRPAGVPVPPRAGVAGAPSAPKAPPAPPAPPAPQAPQTPQAPVISSNPPPGEADEEWASASQQEDGPTMAVASPALAGRPLRDDVVNPRAAPAPGPAPAAGQSPMASPGYRREDSGVDKDADTMALGGDPRRPLLGDGDVEETTRAVSRDELIRHQDASFVVGEDAMGDEATLAVAPGQIDLGLGQNGMAAALAESIKRESQPNVPGAAGAPAFPPPPGFPNSAPMGSSGHLPAAPPHGSHHGQHPGMGMQQQQQPWGGEAAPWGGEQAPPWSQPQPMSGMQQQGYDPMLPGAPPQSNPGMPGGYPQAGQFAAMQQQGQQGYPMQGGMAQGGYGPNANAPTAQQPRPMGMPGGGQPGQMAPWMQPSPQGMSRPTKFTPQVILLVAVGAVCLAIFIIGIVLFVTTKF